MEEPVPSNDDVLGMWRLQQRAFGGEDVATRPDEADEAWWPKGPPHPGVKELIDDLVAKAIGTPGLTLYFLLGGAGNGKSFAARGLAQALGGFPEHHEEDGLARRIYPIEVDGTKVRILNDATIAPREDYGMHQRHALAHDVALWRDEAREAPVVAFCCVNRGIVIDELLSVSRHQGGSLGFGAAVLKWLADPSHDLGGELGMEAEYVDSLGTVRELSEVSLRQGGARVRLVALSVDTNSLLSQQVGVEPTPAVGLFSEVVALCIEDASSRPEACPIRANVEQFRHPDAQTRWGDLLSGAEVASGRVFSYRDVWGLISMSVLGPRMRTVAASTGETETFIDAELQRLESCTNSRERLKVLLSLSRFRASQALFRAPVPTGDEASPSFPPDTPFHAGFALIDPSQWVTVDSTTVEEAMQAIVIGERPSDRLRVDFPSLENWWSTYDHELEDAVVSFVNCADCTDHVHRRLTSWYSAYLMRLLALATGNLGNGEVLSGWRACARACREGPAPVPTMLEPAFRALLYPPSRENDPSRVLVRAFATRMEPVRGSRLGGLLLESLDSGAIILQLRSDRTRVVLECLLMGKGEVVGELLVDFALIREALAWRQAGAGETDASGFVEPRLERCRSASLSRVPPSSRRLMLYEGAEFSEVTT